MPDQVSGCGFTSGYGAGQTARPAFTPHSRAIDETFGTVI